MSIPAPAAPPAVRRRGCGDFTAGFRGAVAAEWIKLWTVRSTWLSLGGAAALVAVFSVITGIASRSPQPAGGGQFAAVPAAATAATGVFFMGQLAALTMAALMIAGEFSTGSIVSSLQGVPVRARLLLAKSAVIVPVLWGAGVLIGLTGMAVAVAARGGHGPSPTAGGVIGEALAIGGYLAFAGVIVIGAGAIARSVAGTLTVTLMLVLVVPVALQGTGIKWVATAGAYLPGAAGQVLMNSVDAAPYGRLAALAVLALWAVAAQLAGYAVFRHYDA